jgi:putative heme-binding domain-containing protein
MVRDQALWWLLNYKDSRWPTAGVNAALKSRGLYDPDQVSLSPSIVPPAGPTALPPAAEVARLTGDAARGARSAQSCLLCHRIGGQGHEYGPGLDGFARGQSTEVVIQAILEPSAEIAHGYDGVAVDLTDGTQIHGRLLTTGDPVVIQSMGGLTQLVPAARIKGSPRKPLGRSLMLSAEQLGLSAQDVADIVAYLKTL